MRRSQASTSSSYRNLQALVDGASSEADLSAGGPLSFGTSGELRSSRGSLDEGYPRGSSRIIFVSNHLPIRVKRESVSGGYAFEFDQDALIAQAKEGLESSADTADRDFHFVGCLPVEIDPQDQEMVALELYTNFNCYPVFLGNELKDKYYKGRFDPELWQAYVKANKAFLDKLVEVLATEEDLIWIHDYHLLVLPSLLRKRFHRLPIGLFLHSPFPSSEIYRTFPKREEILRSMLNADLIGFHTFDYARHFLSCCTRMLGLEHVTSRGSLMLEYYGRNVGVKIMPTGVKPERFLSGFSWNDTLWRRGELLSDYKNQTVLIGVDDMDVFKGIELKIQAVERVLDHHPEWRGKLTLLQVTNAPRSSGRDIQELHDYIKDLADRINAKHGHEGYTPVVLFTRPVPLHEKIAMYSIADCAVVTATRDGMNLVPYEYIVCRQGVPDVEDGQKNSMLVVSEFVGCSPSLSGAIRVNPWSIDNVADAIYSAIKLDPKQRHDRHAKHWRYVSHHTVTFWAQSFVADLKKFTKDHRKMKTYGLGLALDTFRLIALGENFRKLDNTTLVTAYQSSKRRLFLLDYDGTLQTSSEDHRPSQRVLEALSTLCRDERNTVFIISGRGRTDLENWLGSVEGLGLAAEHGFYLKLAGSKEWEAFGDVDGAGWKEMVLPILQVYTESTDGSNIEAKDSALVWHYGAADPDFGHWQAKELQDHLEGVLSNEAVEVVAGNAIVEVKPQGVSKGGAVERILQLLGRSGRSPDFVLCIGDDRSDEDMFQAIEHARTSAAAPSSVFACTVGQKPSRAPFYVNDTAEVTTLLDNLARSSASSTVAFANLPAASSLPHGDDVEMMT